MLTFGNCVKIIILIADRMEVVRHSFLGIKRNVTGIVKDLN